MSLGQNQTDTVFYFQIEWPQKYAFSNSGTVFDLVSNEKVNSSACNKFSSSVGPNLTKRLPKKLLIFHIGSTFSILVPYIFSPVSSWLKSMLRSQVHKAGLKKWKWRESALTVFVDFSGGKLAWQNLKQSHPRAAVFKLNVSSDV